MSTLMQPAPMPRIARQLRRSAATFEAHAAVFESVGERLRDRLGLLAIRPGRVLDLGCRSGYQLAALAGLYPEAEIVGADPAPGAPPTAPASWPAWLRRRPRPVPRLAADPHRLPFADASFDLIVSNLLLPWCHAPHAVFAEAARVLAPGGVMTFTSAGPDTLHEYRALWARVDAHPHGFGLLDMHDLGDAMIGAGFAAPVLDRDEIRVDYPSIDALEEELRRVGAANLARGRRAGLMAPGVRNLLRKASLTPAGEPARFAVTLELVHGHGWKGAIDRGGMPDGAAGSRSMSGRDAPGEHRVGLDALRGILGRRDGDRRDGD